MHIKMNGEANKIPHHAISSQYLILSIERRPSFIFALKEAKLIFSLGKCIVAGNTKNPVTVDNTDEIADHGFVAGIGIHLNCFRKFSTELRQLIFDVADVAEITDMTVGISVTFSEPAVQHHLSK